MSTTIGQWITLPAAGGSQDPMRASEPLGAGRVQILASNATHAARENGLRVVGEVTPRDIHAGLEWTGTSNVDRLSWNDGTTTSSYAGGLAMYLGAHRIRQYGETIAFPRVSLYAEVKSGLEGGVYYPVHVLLAVRSSHGIPSSADLWGEAASSGVAATWEDLAVTLELRGSSLSSDRTFGLRDVTGTTSDVTEGGVMREVHLYVAAWSDAAGLSAGKGRLGGMTVVLREPA